MTGVRPCEVPAAHDGPVRLYLGGWRCTTHAPQPRTVHAEVAPAVRTPVQHRPARRTPEPPRRVTAALFIDMGRQLSNGTWASKPRARYECLACGHESDTVVGALAVTALISHIRTTHRATCPGFTTTEGAHAA
ncbi:hypothetical protein LG634_24840 [Streptomyces bambusae]|uniref:hypothetical protein n=1 Tax=Streptomyces bambusae TaxID=1550616 RepID=UPI001CFEEC81|nr:hypothetical protein [Streptomyces bambusae]MCB5168041.1 hypothetical protein [Streptomyces bambusae]